VFWGVLGPILWQLLFTPRVQSSSAVRYLTVDSKLWSSHQSACQSLLLQTEKHQKLCNVRLLLPTEAAKTVVSSFVVLKIDYCNSRRFVSLTDCRLSVSGILSIGNIFRDRLNNYIGCRSRDASRSSSVCWCSKALSVFCSSSRPRHRHDTSTPESWLPTQRPFVVAAPEAWNQTSLHVCIIFRQFARFISTKTLLFTDRSTTESHHPMDWHFVCACAIVMACYAIRRVRICPTNPSCLRDGSVTVRSFITEAHQRRGELFLAQTYNCISTSHGSDEAISANSVRCGRLLQTE